jgi:hypothetical protein
MPTYDELLQQAKEAAIRNYKSFTRDELIEALKYPEKAEAISVKVSQRIKARKLGKVTPDNLVAMERSGVDVQFLGSLVWFTISDCRVVRDDLAAAFDEAGIDQKYLPKPISPRDAFRRATKRIEMKEIPIGDASEEKFLNLLIRDVRQNKDVIVRHVVREIRDRQNTRLQHLAVADLRLTEQGKYSALGMQPLATLLKEEAAAIDAFMVDYDIEQENYNGRTVRDIIWSVLRDCDPVNVRPSGGVYFTPEEHREKIDSLKRLVSILSKHNTNGHKSSLWSIPVINADEQKEMLQESLEDQVREDSQVLVKEMVDLLGDSAKRKVTKALAQQYIERVQRLGNLVDKYEQTLQYEAVSAKSNYELAMQQAVTLLAKVN